VQATGLGSNILHLLVSISVCLQLRFVKLSINEYVMLCYVKTKNRKQIVREYPSQSKE